MSRTLVVTLFCALCLGPGVEASVVLSIGGLDFSGAGGAPVLNSNAIVLTFEDSSDDGTIAGGTVRLTIDAENLDIVSAKINDIWFNLDDAFDQSLLTLTHAGGEEADSATGWNGEMSTAAAYRPNGDGFHDILLDYNTSDPLFQDDATSVYNITSSAGALTATLFDVFASTPPDPDTNSNSPFQAVAHINEVADGVSGHYGSPNVIPEPAAALVWSVFAAICVGGFGRRIVKGLDG